MHRMPAEVPPKSLGQGRHAIQRSKAAHIDIDQGVVGDEVGGAALGQHLAVHIQSQVHLVALQGQVQSKPRSTSVAVLAACIGTRVTVQQATLVMPLTRHTHNPTIVHAWAGRAAGGCPAAHLDAHIHEGGVGVHVAGDAAAAVCRAASGAGLRSD